jgi:hypothetical protein
LRPDATLRAYCLAVHAGIERGELDLDTALEHTSAAVAARLGLSAEVFGPAPTAAAGLPELPDAQHDAGALGRVYEALLSPAVRRGSGAHFTPPDVARRLATIVLAAARPPSDDRPHPLTVCDPTCGGGAFLLAAADALEAEAATQLGGTARWDRAAIARLLWGADRDPRAVAVTRRAVELWVGERLPWLETHIVVADTLGQRPASVWPAGAPAFDIVLGNPPFLNQLEVATARRPDAVRVVQERFGAAAKGYVDSSALFLLAGLELVREGGVVCLLQPQSVLAAAGARAVRTDTTRRAQLQGLWLGRDAIFGASVRVVAPILRRVALTEPRGEPNIVQRWIGAAVEPVEPIDSPAAEAPTWSTLVTDLLGVPSLPLARCEGTLADMATATAGFRDQFYGLVPGVAESPESPESLVATRVASTRLATVGMVDPLRIAWGARPVRFAGRRFAQPAIDPAAVEPRVRAWVHARLVPKVLVATQTRVVEAAVDPTGRYVPATPLIAVHPDPRDVWRVAAVLTNPYTTALALQATYGTALVSDALKLSASQVLALPLPADRSTWDRAATTAQAATDTADPAAHRRLV